MLFLFIGLTVLDVSAQRKKVGLVLSGGGAKGVAHIGVLKVLEEAGIPVDYIAGTSMGALVGALYSIGYDAQMLDSLVRAQDWTFLLSDKVYRYDLPFSEKAIKEKYLISIPIRNRALAMPSGFVSGQNVYNLFLDLTIGYHDSIAFHHLPVPFRCVASNLVDGKEYVFDRGCLAEAMRASMAIPGAFAPVLKDSMVLVDGGISNNFPADIAKEMGADILIGVDVQAELKNAKGLESVMGVVDQLTSFLGLEKYHENLNLVDLYIKPDITPYSAASFSPSAIDTLILRGETVAREQWDELIALKEKIGITDEIVSQERNTRMKNDLDSVNIGRVIIQGADERDDKWLHSIIRIKDNSRVSFEKIRTAVSKLYGSGAFSRVSFLLTERDQKKDLTFVLERGTTNSVNFGLRFDTEEMAAILLNTTFGHKSMHGSRISITGRLSTNPYVTIDYSLGNTFLRRFNVSYTYRYNDLDLYYKGDKSHNVNFHYHHANLGLTNLYFRNYQMKLGLRYEYFDYDSFLFVDPDGNQEVVPEGLFSYYLAAEMETFDKRYYPNRGMAVRGQYSLYTDNLLTHNDGSPFHSIGFSLESVLSITRRVKLLPSLYGRILIGKEIPYPTMNCAGGTVNGRYMAQQLPFIGIQNVEIVDNSVVIARLHARYRLGSRHYVSLIGDYMKHHDDFFDILGGEERWGVAPCYSYDSFIGPIDVMLAYSNWTKKVGFFFNLGYYF